MHIGLIGGIGPAATDYYYRRLITQFAARSAPLDATIVHADSRTLLGHLERDDASAQVAIYQRLTDRLAAAGADCVAVTSIAGHFCIEPFKATSPLPVVDMVAEVRADVARSGLKRIGVLGTRTVMETRFYGGVGAAALIPPSGARLDAVHAAYVAMAAAGRASDAERAVMLDASEALIREEGVEAIMLGGTDLTLVFDAETRPYPLVDCAAIHVDALVRRALG